MSRLNSTVALALILLSPIIGMIFGDFSGWTTFGIGLAILALDYLLRQ